MSEIDVLTPTHTNNAKKPFTVLSLNELLKQKQIDFLRPGDAIFEQLADVLGQDFTKHRYYKLCRNANNITLREAHVLTQLFGANVTDLIQPVATASTTAISDKFSSLK